MDFLRNGWQLLTCFDPLPAIQRPLPGIEALDDVAPRPGRDWMYVAELEELPAGMDPLHTPYARSLCSADGEASDHSNTPRQVLQALPPSPTPPAAHTLGEQAFNVPMRELTAGEFLSSYRPIAVAHAREKQPGVVKLADVLIAHGTPPRRVPELAMKIIERMAPPPSEELRNKLLTLGGKRRAARRNEPVPSLAEVYRDVILAVLTQPASANAATMSR